MARPRFFRDPVHGQIRYDQVNLTAPPPPETSGDKRLSWLMLNLIDTPEFQRLRHIRQTSIANFVFHGAEHSRFSHSMGAAWLAQAMFDRIVRNMDEPAQPELRMATCAAALLHDIGHGPFSHTLEDILSGQGIPFDHENMTRRIIAEPESRVNRVLAAIDPQFPDAVAAFFDKGKRPADHWMYRIVSSQLDCDRLDYVMRDSLHTGMLGTSFDLPRLLDTLMHDAGTRIAVHRKGMATVESYLIALDLMYRSVYFHHTSRAAAFTLRAVLHRAWQLFRDTGRFDLFMEFDEQRTRGFLFAEPRANPLRQVFEHGENINLAAYSRLSEFHVWALIEHWQFYADAALRDLAHRMIERRLFKTLDLDPNRRLEGEELVHVARDIARRELPKWVTEQTADLYVAVDTSLRSSYRRNVWGSGDTDEAIWIVSGDSAKPIDKVEGRQLVRALLDELLFPRLVFPGEIREKLLAVIKQTPRLKAAVLHTDLF